MEYLASGGAAREATRKALVTDQISLQAGLSTLPQTYGEVEQLTWEVKNLITPAVALSKSFTERRDSLKRSRILWLCICGVIAIVGILSLLRVASEIAGVVTPNDGFLSMWPVVALRSLFLVPIFVLLGFSISQYRKERNFEEEYAHKAAVAVSLPNYGDLVPPGSVRDQIVTGAANVIFSSPIGRTTEPENSGDVIAAAKEIIDAASKLII